MGSREPCAQPRGLVSPRHAHRPLRGLLTGALKKQEGRSQSRKDVPKGENGVSEASGWCVRGCR